MANNRNIVLDIAKGVGILLVIVGYTAGMKHICQELIYSFHMPLFFIIAGYLYHRQDIKTLIAKSAKRLLLPWIVTILLQVVLCLLLGNKTEAWGYAQSIFFPDGTRDDNMLFFYAAIEQRLGNRSIYVTIPLTIIAVLLGRFVLNLPFAIQMGCSALLFYEIGYRAKTNEVLDKGKLRWGVLLFIPLWIFYERYVTVNMIWYQYGLTYPIDVIVALVASYSLVVASIYITKSGWLSCGLEWLGKNSLYILCAHTLMLLVLGYGSEMLPSYGWVVMLINMCMSILLAIGFVNSKDKIIRLITTR